VYFFVFYSQKKSVKNIITEKFLAHPQYFHDYFFEDAKVYLCKNFIALPSLMAKFY